MGGSHWTCFYKKDNPDSTSHSGSAKQSFCFDSFGGFPDKILRSQLPKPIAFHNYKPQDINNGFGGT